LNNSNQTSSTDADVSQFSVPISSEGIRGIKTDDPNTVTVSAQAFNDKIVLTDSSDYKYLFSVAIPYSTTESLLTNGSVQMTHKADDNTVDAIWNCSVSNNSGYAVFENLPFSTVTITPIVSEINNWNFDTGT